KPPPALVVVRDLATGKVVHNFGRHRAQPLAVAFSPDGTLAASGDAAGQVFVWEAATGKVLTARAFPGEKIDRGQIQAAVRSLAFAPDGTKVAVARDLGVVSVWALATGRDAAVLTAAVKGALPVLGVAWRPDGKQIASAGADGAVRLWDAATGKRQRL